MAVAGTPFWFCKNEFTSNEAGSAAENGPGSKIGMDGATSGTGTEIRGGEAGMAGAASGEIGACVCSSGWTVALASCCGCCNCCK